MNESGSEADGQPDAEPKKPRHGPISSRQRLGAVRVPQPKKGAGPLVWIGAALSLLLASCCLTSTLIIPTWTNFTPADGKFTASFPGKPEVTTKTFTTANGPVAFTSYSVKSTYFGRVYGVQVYESAAATPRPAGDPDARLETLANGVPSEFNGRLGTNKPITLGPLHGREVEVLGAQGGIPRAIVRLYPVENRLYEVLIFQVSDPETKDHDLTFLDSFRLH